MVGEANETRRISAMYFSTLVDLLVVVVGIPFAIYKLLDWFYTGVHEDIIFWSASAGIYAVIIALMIWSGPMAERKKREDARK